MPAVLTVLTVPAVLTMLTVLAALTVPAVLTALALLTVPAVLAVCTMLTVPAVLNVCTMLTMRAVLKVPAVLAVLLMRVRMHVHICVSACAHTIAMAHRRLEVRRCMCTPTDGCICAHWRIGCTDTQMPGCMCGR